jgi:putative transposase
VILSRETRELPLERCCQLLKVSRSLVYSDWSLKAPEGLQGLKAAAKAKPFYGYRRLCFEVGASPKATRRLMKRAGLRGRCRGRHKPSSVPGGSSFEGSNLWRNRKVRSVQTVLASDVTYVKLGERFGFIAVTLDLCSRKVLGWAVSDRNDNALTLACLGRCTEGREPGWIHHSDRGHNYTSHAFTEMVASTSGLSSFSRAARPYDNAVWTAPQK